MEAIKGAVQYGLGAAFISSAAITKELDLGLFKRIDISGVRLNRTLSLVRLLRLPPSCSAIKLHRPFSGTRVMQGLVLGLVVCIDISGICSRCILSPVPSMCLPSDSCASVLHLLSHLVPCLSALSSFAS